MNSRFAGRWAVAAAASAPAGVPAGGPVEAGAPMSGAGSPTSTGEIRSGCRGAGRTTTASEGPWPLHSSVPSSNATEIPRSSPSKGRGGFPHEHFTAGSPRASTGIEIPARSGAEKGTAFPFFVVVFLPRGVVARENGGGPVGAFRYPAGAKTGRRRPCPCRAAVARRGETPLQPPGVADRPPPGAPVPSRCVSPPRAAASGPRPHAGVPSERAVPVEERWPGGDPRGDIFGL